MRSLAAMSMQTLRISLELSCWASPLRHVFGCFEADRVESA
jgi:hypothetical protein